MGPGVPLEPLAHIARRLQSQDVTVMAIAIGQQVPINQLLNLTNSIEENILEVDTFANLLSIINQFVNISCTGVFIMVKTHASFRSISNAHSLIKALEHLLTKVISLFSQLKVRGQDRLAKIN